METVIDWFAPKGYITFFKKPAQTLRVTVKTDKTQYLPGDLVKYTATVLNVTSNSPAKDCYINMVVTDDMNV